MSCQDVHRGKGYGYIDKEGKTCMIRCFECGVENYAMAVASGYCAHCLHTENPERAADENKQEES